MRFNIQTFFVFKGMKKRKMKHVALLGAFIVCVAGNDLSAQVVADTTLSIQDVEVRGRRFAGLSNGEMKRLQVENNLSSISATTAEAFRQIPSLITDIEGGVTFRGSNKPGLLMNGIPYGLLEEYSGDVLIQLPALFFDRIMMSAFTSADIVPDGDAGSLNLASTRYSAEDSPLQLTLGAGWHERYNAGAIVNVHPGKFHIVGKYNYRREYRSRKFDKTTVTKQNTTVMNNNADARPDVHLADLSIGYDLTSNDLVAVYGLYHLMDYSRYGGINNRVFNPVGEQMKYVLRHRYNDQRQEAYAAEARWEHRFKKGNKLKVLFNYNNFVYDEDNDYKNENTATGKIAAEDNLFIRQQKDNFYWTVGYTHPFSGTFSLKAGYIGRAKLESFSTEANDKKEEIWVPNVQKTYAYDVNRYLNLLYVSLQKRWNNFSAEIALQGEASHLKVDGEVNNAFRVYPHLYLGYDFRHSDKLTFQYQERVIRPYGSYLNTYVDYSDATHLIQGNPDLKDEVIHSFEFAYQWNGSGYRITPALYYRNRDNRIMELAIPIGEETIWRKENIGNTQTLGFELAASWSPVRFLTVGASGDVYRDEIDARNIGYGEKKSLVCWDVKGNVNIQITPTTELQIDGFYISDQLTPQGKIEGHYCVNAGMSQYFLDRRLRANLSVNNIFDSLEETTLINTDAMQMKQVRNRDARVAWLMLSYSF